MKRKILTGLGSSVAPCLSGFNSGLLRRRLPRRVTATAADIPLTLTARPRIRLGPSILRWIRFGSRKGSWSGFDHDGFVTVDTSSPAVTVDFHHGGGFNVMVAADMTSPIRDTAKGTIAADPTRASNFTHNRVT